jgi:hypothetical protein
VVEHAWRCYTTTATFLATRVLSQVVNTSFAERCWSTYNFIHSVRRNGLNVGRAKSPNKELGLCSLQLAIVVPLLEEAKMDKRLKCWDNNLEEDSLEDRVLLLEQLENVLLDDDDHVEMPPSSTSMVPMSRIPTATLGASSSLPPWSSNSTSTFAQFCPFQEASLPPRGGPHNNCSGGRRMG